MKTTPSLKYIKNKIEFNGTFSGSFIGDGSGLTGVTATTPASLNSSLGLGKSGSLDPFSFNGGNKVVAQVITASGGGIEYAAGGIRLISSLAGNGLQWETQYNKLEIDLNGDSDGDSGLKLTPDGLAISDNIAGNGLQLSSGEISL